MKDIRSKNDFETAADYGWTPALGRLQKTQGFYYLYDALPLVGAHGVHLIECYKMPEDCYNASGWTMKHADAMYMVYRGPIAQTRHDKGIMMGYVHFCEIIQNCMFLNDTPVAALQKAQADIRAIPDTEYDPYRLSFGKMARFVGVTGSYVGPNEDIRRGIKPHPESHGVLLPGAPGYGGLAAVRGEDETPALSSPIPPRALAA